MIVIQKYIYILMSMTTHECTSLYVYILSHAFLSLKLKVYCFILQKERLVYIGGFSNMPKTHMVPGF